MPEQTPAPGSGKFECDEVGLIVERFPDGTVSFDIFNADDWPGGFIDGLAYAKILITALEEATDDRP